MLIKSNFQDYYDGGAVNGIDTERMYLRLTKGETTATRFDMHGLEVIGFCGKIYPFVNFSSKIFSDWTRHPKDYTLYGEDAILYDFKEGNRRDVFVKSEARPTFGFNLRREEFIRSLENNVFLKGLFLEYKTPIFHFKAVSEYHWRRGSEHELTINPKLSDFAFYKVKPTIEAFQEIEMYVSNVLTNTESAVMPVGSDLDILKGKGFDPKFSFRKEKQNSK